MPFPQKQPPVPWLTHEVLLKEIELMEIVEVATRVALSDQGSIKDGLHSATYQRLLEWKEALPSEMWPSHNVLPNVLFLK